MVKVIKDTPCKERTVITIIIQYNCSPGIGDKFASRSGCKGVISAILEEKDMPRSADTGIVPDIIFSPLSTVTRMLVGQICEAALSKYCVQTGQFADGTGFMSFDDKIVLDFDLKNDVFDKTKNITDNLTDVILGKIKRYVVNPGQSPTKEIFRDPSTGKIINVPVFVVP